MSVLEAHGLRVELPRQVEAAEHQALVLGVERGTSSSCVEDQGVAGEEVHRHDEGNAG